MSSLCLWFFVVKNWKMAAKQNITEQEGIKNQLLMYVWLNIFVLGARNVFIVLGSSYRHWQCLCLNKVMFFVWCFCCIPGQAAPDDIPLTSLEESLLSLEKLDRASPELWPEQSKYLWYDSNKHIVITWFNYFQKARDFGSICDVVIPSTITYCIWVMAFRL